MLTNTEPEKVTFECDGVGLTHLHGLPLFFFFIQPGIIFGTEDLFLVGMESEAIVILK